MTAPRFIAASLATCLVLLLGYFVAVDRLAIPHTRFGKSYRQFLLHATDTLGPRIIVDSGSNALHALDAGVLERHFGRVTVIVADNAGYPLRHKILRLRKHLRPGDVAVLPLEWVHYRAGEDFPADYVQSIVDAAGSNAFYYSELSLVERMRFVLEKLPPVRALQAVAALNALPGQNPELARGDAASAARFFREILQDGRGSRLVDGPLPLEPLTRGLGCDHYLFGLFEEPRVSATFRADLRLLEDTRRATGADIMLAWPAVASRVDSACYTELAAARARFIAAIRAELDAHGFTVPGEPEQSRFGSECLLDSYYHVARRCAKTYTEQLVAQLEQHGLRPQRGPDPAQIRAHLLHYLHTQGTARAPLPLDVPLDVAELVTRVDFAVGWQAPEAERVWSDGAVSELYVDIGGAGVRAVRLRGEYFDGAEQTVVWLNGRRHGSCDLRDCTLELDGAVDAQAGLVLRLEYAREAQVPSRLGVSGDTRAIRYGLASVEFIGAASPPRAESNPRG